MSAIHDARRGIESAEIEFTLEDGVVLFVRAYGHHPDEALRTRETLLAALTASGITVVA